MKRTIRPAAVAALAAVALACSAPAFAAQEHQHDHPQPAPAPSAPAPSDPHAGHQMPAAPPAETPMDATAQTPAQAGPVVRLADIEQTAMTTSPAIKQAEAAVRAAEGRAKQAGLYPNPTAG